LSETGRTFRQALTIGALGVLVAAAVHFPLVERFVRGEFRETFLSRTDYPGVCLISIEEAEDLWAGGGAVLLDARNIAADEPDPDMTAGVRDILRERTVVVYCEGGDCQSSLHLARRLHDKGFEDIRVLTGGWDEWKKAGLPEERDHDEE
jgi:rhodanese-related sulfurtransferase